MKRHESAPPRPQLSTLLCLQFLFMIGFAAVVPFLAAIGQQRYDMDAMSVGLVVGLRVACQQGLFVAGGALSDLFSPRRLLVAGCLTRALGLGIIAIASGPGPFVVAVILIGMAGALFSPAVDSLIGSLDAQRTSGVSPFAWLAIAGESGGTVAALAAGPIMPAHVTAVGAAASAIFIIAAVIVVLRVPEPQRGGSAGGTGKVLPQPDAGSRADGVPAEPAAYQQSTRIPGIRGGRLLTLALAGSVFLAVYTQVFSAIPIMLRSGGIAAGWIGVVAATLSVGTICLQYPVARLTERIGRISSIFVGFGCAAGAGLLAAAVPTLAHGRICAGLYCAVALLVALSLMFGQPAAQSLVASTPSAWRAVRLALIPSAGGVMSLLLSTLTGSLLDSEHTAEAWLLTAALPVLAMFLAWWATRPLKSISHAWS